MRLTYPVIVFALILLPFEVTAESIRVAVASNFNPAMRALVDQFEQQSGHEVTLISGSTGKIYAQIINGAPFDVFFAADVERPRQLEQDNLIQSGSRFTYAIGQVVLWSPDPDIIDDNACILNSDNFHHLAIANPRLAPYGQAARQILEAKGVWNTLQNRIVRGENIGQTFQFVKSGNAELGFVALSQLKHSLTGDTGSQWWPPVDLYDPIEQQAVQLSNKAAAADLLAFVQSAEARQLIQQHGYTTP